MHHVRNGNREAKAEKIFALPDVKGLFTEAVNEHNFNPSWVYRPG